MLLLVLISVIMILFWWLNRKPLLNHEPPLHVGFLPIIGHAHLLIGDSKHFWRLINTVSNECIAAGNVTTFMICGRKFYLVTDPEDCLTVANSCLEKDLIYRSARACFGDGLVTASTSTWKEHRKLLNPKFNVNYLLSFVGVFNEQSKVLIKQLDSKVQAGPFDHGVIIRHNEMKTICLTSLGVDFNKDGETLRIYADAFDQILNSLTEQVQRFWLHVNFFWQRSNLKKKRDYNRDVMCRITERIMQQRRVDQHNNKDNHDCDGAKHFKPFLDVFFELKKTVGDEFMSDKTIRDHVNTLILAGHDTIAAALQFSLILIGSYPEVQERLYSELREIFGESDRDVEREDLRMLVYLEAVLKETLRVYSVAPIVARYVNEDVKLKKFTLAAGNCCILILHGVHRHSMWGEDADEFKPERWLDPNTLPANSHAFVAFSLGRRFCIGKTYAMISMKITLAHILRRYTITADHSKIDVKLECLLKVVSGHCISIGRR